MASATGRGFPFPVVGDRIRDFVTTAKALADFIDANLGREERGTVTVTIASGASSNFETVNFAPFAAAPNIQATSGLVAAQAFAANKNTVSARIYASRQPGATTVGALAVPIDWSAKG